MLSNKKAVVLCPKQVDEKLAELADYDKFSNRINSTTPGLLSDTNLIVSEIAIRILRLEHSHFSELDAASGEMVNRHRNVENLGFYFDISGTGIFHCGDTNPLNEDEYKTFRLDEENIHLAFLERLFVLKGERSMEIIQKYIAPETTVFMHIRPANKKNIANFYKGADNVMIFSEPFEKYTFSFSH